LSKKPEPAALSSRGEKALRKFYLDAAECMSQTGRVLLTLTELRAWLAQGRPANPAEHVYDGGECILADLYDHFFFTLG